MSSKDLDMLNQKLLKMRIGLETNSEKWKLLTTENKNLLSEIKRK